MEKSPIPLDSLESIRNKLNQVHLSLRKLADQIGYQNRFPGKSKLPNYGQFQNQFQILITQLHSITSVLENNEDILKNSNAYPLPSFPTTHQEGLLTTLLRKKPIPEVDDWIEEAINKSQSLNIDLESDNEFAKWCSMKVQELRNEFQFYGFLSTEELENLETEEGKKQAQHNKDIEREKDDLESSITAGGKPGLHPHQVLKFMCQGKLE